MGWNALGVSYDVLLGFGMITDMDFLKWLGQCSVWIQVLVMLVICSRHASSKRIDLMWFHKIWSGPREDAGEHFLIASFSSWLEKGGHLMFWQLGTSFRKLELIGRFCAELYDWCSAFYNWSKVTHWEPWKVIASIAGRNFFQTQFIRSPGPFVGWRYFKDFGVKEFPFWSFYCVFKVFPVFNVTIVSVFVKAVSAVTIPPLLGVFCDMSCFRVFIPSVMKDFT